MGDLQWEYEANRRGPRGRQGVQGLPGTNGVATDVAVATNIGSPLSRTNQAVRRLLGVTDTVNVADFSSLRAAYDALPSSGGTIRVPVGRFRSGDWTYDTQYLSKPNVRIIGEKLPRVSDTVDRLVDGSVLEGRLNVFADGFEIDNVGIDVGKYVVDTYLGGADTHSANYPVLGGTWDAFAFAQPNMGAPLRARVNVRIGNVIGLVRDPQSLGHAILVEGIDGGSIGEAVGIGGVHSCAVKSMNMRIGRLCGIASSLNNVIIKSDTYGACGRITIDQVLSARTPAGTAPWFTPAQGNGLHIQAATANFTGPIQISLVRAMQCSAGIRFSGGAGRDIVDVQLGLVLVDGYSATTAAAVALASVRAARISIDSLTASNVTDGVTWAPGTGQPVSMPQIVIGYAKLNGVLATAYYVGPSGRVRVRACEVDGATNVTYIDDGGRFYCDSPPRVNGVTAFWGRGNPSLATGWSNFGSGNPDMRLTSVDGGHKLEGLILAGAGATGLLMTLAVMFRPSKSRRFTVPMVTGGTRSAAMVTVGSDGAVYLNDNTAPTAGAYVSLDGVGWEVS